MTFEVSTSYVSTEHWNLTEEQYERFSAHMESKFGKYWKSNPGANDEARNWLHIETEPDEDIPGEESQFLVRKFN